MLGDYDRWDVGVCTFHASHPWDYRSHTYVSHSAVPHAIRSDAGVTLLEIYQALSVILEATDGLHACSTGRCFCRQPVAKSRVSFYHETVDSGT